MPQKQKFKNNEPQNKVYWVFLTKKKDCISFVINK